VQAGSTVRFGARRTGARAYLAIGGGFSVRRMLGSRATHVPTRMGGWDGRALVRGDRLPLGPVDASALRLNRTAIHGAPMPGTAREGSSAHPTRSAAGGEDGREPGTTDHGPTVVRVLAGPQDDRFAPDALESLTAEAYVVGVESNRMAYRLEGRPIRHRAGADIISDATPIGSLQVPESGQPLLLMADRQTTGGYAKIATVITADIGIAAQLAPGDRFRFRVCDRAEALSALIAREQELLVLERGAA
jgi:antagonist of KipI